MPVLNPSVELSADLPAVLGGAPALPADHAEAERWPRLDHRDEAAVLEVMRDGDLSTHPVTRALEEDYKLRFGVKHALAHANGTLALMAAFRAAGLKPGDEVIVPSATWWASAVPALWMGAVPVFAETEADHAGLDPADVARRITARTRAIVVVHLWGVPSRMDELLPLARAHGLCVIEDASHAHGATWRGRLCGTLGDIGVFSLQAHKLAPAGEGGILLTDCDAVFARAAEMGDVYRCWELPGPERRFAGTTFGIKTRMAPMSAAVGRSQLARLDDHNAVRRANCAVMEESLEAAGMKAFRPPAGCERVWFELLMRIPEGSPLSAADWVAALAAEGCRVTKPRYPLLHQQPLFTEGRWNDIARLVPTPEAPLKVYDPADLPSTSHLSETLVRFPVFTRPAPDLVAAYGAAAQKIARHAGAVHGALAKAA